MGTRPRKDATAKAVSHVPVILTPPAPPNHRVWWILLAGIVGTAIVLTTLGLIYTNLAAQNAPPPGGWQQYFDTALSQAAQERTQILQSLDACHPRQQKGK